MAEKVKRRLSKDTQDKLVELVKSIQERQRKNTEHIDKFRAIDESYAKQKIELDKDPTDCDATTEEVLKVPIVASEVDTVASELTSTFVDQDPLFGVLSDRGNPELAMQFQALLSRDARYQRWGRQLALYCSNAARYNFAGIEIDKIWQRDNNLLNDEATTEATFESIIRPVTALKAIDMYNALYDYRVPPADLAFEGEYVGYNELYTRTRLKTLGNMLTQKDYVYNATKAYNSQMGPDSQYWNIRPDISVITPISPEETQDWLNWAGIVDDETRVKMLADSYLVTKLYVRIIPSEFGISGSATPIIIQLRVVNNTHLFSYKEVITPLDMLPILFCDLREDGFGYQTHSVGENVKPYQDAATTLLDVRLEGSKRALSDRALYYEEYINSLQINNRVVDKKIPVKAKLKNSGELPPLSSLYHSIPFDPSATNAALQDMSTLLSLKDEINGVNFTRRGEQRKGNRTLGEFDQLAAAGSGRSIPYNIRMEEQVMLPMKLLIKSYTLSVNEGIQDVFDTASEQQIQVNMAQLRSAMLEYRITGGARNKQVLRDPNLLSTALQAVQNSQELNMEYSTAGIFADIFASVNIDISKHKRKEPLNAGDPTQPNPAVPPTSPDPTNQG